VGYCGSLVFNVGFGVDGGAQRVTPHYIDRGFGGRGTVPDDIGHNETVLPLGRTIQIMFPKIVPFSLNLPYLSFIVKLVPKLHNLFIPNQLSKERIKVNRV
jgi:hypothetical protein